ncbi:MAG: AraC family transcriptional regulator [Bacteroidales bacterium]|nr:AraC family transcriptional regulator [Bacteroidales bacterium]
MSEVLYEISQLSERDCFDIAERYKSSFTYPIHRHKEFELNFVQNAKGVRRVVGDSVEEIGDYDLVLIGGEELEHVWEQGNCTSTNIREITIQFPKELFYGNFLDKNQFASILKMLASAEHGISFPMESIMRVYSQLDTVTHETDGFMQVLEMFKILYDLSRGDYKQLSSSSFANASRDQESRRIKTVKQYINDHYTEDLSLNKLAALIGMGPSSFSRFFKQHTNRTLTSYITDIRLGIAARALVDSTQNISEICYSCGFNNLSNFNRIFKEKKGMAPKEFRALYRKNKVIV